MHADLSRKPTRTVVAIRRPVRWVAIGGLLVSGIALTGGCSSGSGSAAPAATSAGATSSAATTASPDDESSGTATRPADALASAVPSVTRTNAPDTKVSAAPAAFSAPVTFGDGVSVRVTGVKQSTDTGKGPGVFVGSPITQVSVELVNKSKNAIKLDQVVASMLYGEPQRMASPVYQDGAKDFSGTVGADETATAVYMFSVPTSDLTKVSLAVDFDGGHTAATFEGSVA